MHKPRILVAGPLPPPVGGVETVTQALLESPALAAFTIAHCDLTKGRPKETQGQFDVGNLWWALIHMARMRRCVRRFRPQLIYMPLSTTWSGFWRDAALAWLARRGGARLVGHVHGPKVANVVATRGIARWFIRRCLALYDEILVLTPAWVKLLADFGYGGNLDVVPSTFRRAVLEAGNEFQRDYRVENAIGLYVGQVGRRKGVGDLLDALARLKDAGRPAKVVIVGPAQLRGEWEALNRQRTELGLEDDVVEFKGPLQGEALYEEFRRAGYFILPSHHEGLPVVFFEAGSFGLPVIATPVGGITQLLQHERNSLLVIPGDVEEIANAIERLRSSAVERQKYGTQLRQDIQHYHPDAVCARIVAILKQLLETTGVETSEHDEQAPRPRRAAN